MTGAPRTFRPPNRRPTTTLAPDVGKPHLELGYVARAHGMNGEVGVKTFDPASETLFDVPRALLKLRSGEERVLSIQEVRDANKELLVTFQQIRRREAAEELVGSTVFVFREDLPVPAEGEYFQGDLVGLTARSEAGDVLGVVKGFLESGPVPNLVIERAGEGTEVIETLIPFIEDFIVAVDLPGGTVTVRPLEFPE